METVWALITHAILSVGVVAFIFFGIENRPFNVTGHFATVQIIGGNTTTLPFSLTQSDIVTILSSIIAVQKWAIMAWVVPLCWRIAMFLMERRGLRHGDLKTLIDFRLLNPRTYLHSLTTFVIGTLLLASLAANLSTPIVTGSISWVPKNQLAHGLDLDPAWFLGVEVGPLSPVADQYAQGLDYREAFVGYSVGRVNIGWGNDTEKGVYKRVAGGEPGEQIRSLAIDSIIENVTLPYFEVHSIEWIKNFSDIHNFPINGTDTEEILLKPLNRSNPTDLTWLPLGYALLIPNAVTNWSSDPMDATTITDKRLLMFYHAVKYGSGTWNLTLDLPDDVYRAQEDIWYYSFAWVTFSAGVGRCKEYNCVISSPSTVQNNTPIELEPHRLTARALAIAPSVSINLVAENSSIPFPLYNVSDYIEAVLVRSYSGAWITLNYEFSTEEFNAGYVPSLPALVADVNRGRVYGWLGIQLSVTLLSIVFLILQSRLSKHPLIGDTSLTAFYLDTTGVPRSDNNDPFMNGTLKVKEEAKRLKLKVE
ncbi:hypothetical protein FRC11_009369 [Ceratobasidium sp. 423]|nr:hypothetical protein FRC11_009369 [Ceratobasidium sp. 423]